MRLWTSSAWSSSVAVTQAYAADTSGDSSTPERAATPSPGPTSYSDGNPHGHLRPEPYDGEYLATCIPLRPRELAELMERGRRHDHKPVFRWMPDGTGALQEPAPKWATDWLDEYRRQ